MRNIKMTIEYDGSKYNGWQRLGNTDNTIQQKIENVLERMTEEKIEIIGSGRTDAGVHALGQVANFHTNSQLTVDAIRDYCNQYLPQDIVIRDVEEVEHRFHARYNAVGKKYVYSIWNSKIPTAFHRKYTYFIPEKLNIAEMKKGSRYFVGTHDFQAFTSMKSKKKSTVREIYSIEFQVEGPRLDIIYRGNGFLHNMIRIMTGTLIEIGQGKLKAKDIEGIMAGKVRANAGVTAPAQGLCLYEVYYE
ncbi:MAG: tRNA pseudouridine(38-40) synthase TruA [Bacillota bacterium]